MIKDSKNSACSSVSSLFSNLSSDHIKQLTSHLSEEIGDFLQNKKGEVLSAKNKCKNHIKESPFLALTGALAVGVLLGMVFKK